MGSITLTWSYKKPLHHRVSWLGGVSYWNKSPNRQRIVSWGTNGVSVVVDACASFGVALLCDVGARLPVAYVALRRLAFRRIVGALVPD